MHEEAIAFGKTGSLIGVVTSPASSGRLPAAILLNAGIVHRVGPNRLHVRMARALAERGATVLRFDHSGIGDSAPRADALPFGKSSVAEVREAMDWLSARKGCTRFVLIGLCSGTLTAFRTACEDNRVVGAVLLNALLEDPATIGENVVAEVVSRKVARSYLRDKAWDRQSWAKFFRGAASYRRILEVLLARVTGWLAVRPLPAGAAEVARQLARLTDQGRELLFVYSEGTGVLEYFRLTLARPIRRLRRRQIMIQFLSGTDHNFTGLRHQARVVQIASDWFSQLAP